METSHTRWMVDSKQTSCWFFYPLSLAELLSVASLRGLDLMLRLPSHTSRTAERVPEHANRDADEER